jgi:tetratricopeptide (TPR) repeat protein
MGRVRILKGDLAGAEASYREAIDLRERAYGPRDVRTLLSRRHLASCLRRQGGLREARALYDSIEREARAAGGYPALEMAAIINGRAFIDSAEGNLELALQGYRDALEAVRPVLATDDYRVGRSLFNIAVIEERMSNAPGAVDRRSALRADALRHAAEALSILRKRKGGGAATVVEVEALLKRLQELSDAT